MDALVKEVRVRYITSLIVASIYNVFFLICLYSILNITIYFPLLSLEGLWSLMIIGLNASIFTFANCCIYKQFKTSDVGFGKNNGFFLILFDQNSLRFSLTMLVIGMLESLTVSYFLGYSIYYLWTLEYGGFLGFSFAVFVISENYLTLTYENKSISHIELFMDSLLQNSARTVGRIVYFMLFCVTFHIVALHDFRFRFLEDLNFSVLFELYVIGFFIFNAWCSALLIMQGSLTLNLPPLESDDTHLIAVKDFLGSSNSNGLVYHLLLSRLADAVARDAKLRDQVFNITNISGKVIMWEELSSKCLAKVEVFLNGLNLANAELTSKPPSFFSALTHPYQVGNQSVSKVAIVQRSFGSYLQSLLTRIPSALSQIPLVHLLMRDIPFASTWRLFSSGGTNRAVSVWNCDESSHQTGQAVIWATEVIGILVLSSYTEDRLGAVQQSLGRILSIIDESIEAVETHFKLVGLASPNGFLLSSTMNGCRSVSDVSMVDDNPSASVQTYRYASDANLPWRMHSTLRWALISSLKRFGRHLKTLQIDPKRRVRLERLMENVETQSETF